MARPLFSIVIPTYNRSELVQGAVRSIIRQTWEDLEIVVSDNGSEDDTADVIRGFQDPRVRYVRTPSHTSIAHSWEFARSQARGALIMMLSDDDALVHDALAQFAEQHRRHGAEFLFCNLAEYRDRSFPGPQRNTVSCPPCSGAARIVSREEFLGPLFRFRPSFNMHPSAFVFAARVADEVARRCGRFFKTNGVEYFAWPPAAVFSRGIVNIDRPLVILGRTAKSWGSTIVLANPGKEQIARMIADVEHDRDWIPLTNFTLCNLMAEGLLLSKRTFPEALSPYPFDERQYLRDTTGELTNREALGVDVSGEFRELLEYAAKDPSLRAELQATRESAAARQDSWLRKAARRSRLNVLYRHARRIAQARNVRRGRIDGGFTVAGSDFEFSNALECADFVARVSGSPAPSPVAPAHLPAHEAVPAAALKVVQR